MELLHKAYIHCGTLYITLPICIYQYILCIYFDLYRDTRTNCRLHIYNIRSKENFP